MSRQIRHGQSHASLLRDVSTSVVPSSRSRLDVIVVPTARPSSALQNVINLSATLSVPLVILCSRQANVGQVAQRVEKTFGARALVIDVPDGYQLLDKPHLTSAPHLRQACAERSSDLSVKRNVGLLLGRLRGWNKILFVDDDINQLRPLHVEQVSSVLDRHAVASMASREFPDNSVVCHGRRLAGLDQDVFVSGAVLGVNLQHPALSFFPDIYNEDWFFFARHAAARCLPKVGEVRQAEYLPFADSGRAEREEFGDLLAEGLYALFESTPRWDFKEQLTAASRKSHWQDFREIRAQTIQEAIDKLWWQQSTAGAVHNRTMLDAEDSLRYAEKQLSGITADLCVDFIQSWQEDEHRWQQVLRRHTAALSQRDALSELGLSTSIPCGYGINSMSFGAVGSKPKSDLTAAGAVS
ncbi:hypothetical protein OG558_14680 [Kribbella sp. NBC_01510]|uniref:hypothetical protein n=1 Tax=Kribbella sp. NBC_01510 TaxID=2903581 RepID=UPI00386A9389